MYATEQLEAAREKSAREAVLREQDERLAAEMARRKTQSVREAKNVQRICEQSAELRDLEEKLRAAYVNKEREAQIKESAVLIARQSESEMAMAHAMEADRRRGLQAEAYRDYLRVQDGRAMRDVLDVQVKEKETTRRAEALAAFLKEKEMVDQVVDEIIAEDAKEKLLRKKQEASIKADIESTLREQELLKERRRLENEAQNAEIRQYAEAVMHREQQLRLSREKDQMAKDARLEGIAAEMAAKAREKEEMESLRNELVMQEAEESVLLKEREKMEREIQRRLDIALANEYQKQLKAIKRTEEKEEEDKFRQAMLDKFAEDDRLDQLNAQKRRMKQLEHRREIDILLERRREAYEAERAAELQKQVDESRVEEIRSKIIEEERQRLLAMHAKNLGVEHLPKGVLTSESDLALFSG